MNHRIVAIASSLSLLVAPLAGCERDATSEFLMTTTTLESSSAPPGPDDGWQPEGAAATGAAYGDAPPAFTREQLEQLVAPIALYPDALLMEILMAATYPAEVAEAAIWAKDHPDLVGKQLDDAIADKNWDVSVKAVTHAPKALELMAADPQWTRDLGDAFLAQQMDVLNAVQVMRQKACDLGTLKTNEHQQVLIEDAPPPATQQPAQAQYVVPPPQQVVRILPVQQNLFYVPVYNPRVIYGPPPPTIYYPRAWLYPSFGVGIAPVISFGVGLTIGALLWADADWYHGRVYYRDRWYDHRHDYYRYGRPYRYDYWRHDPYHRRGISYPTRYVETRIFERRDDGRERFVRGSREFEGRLPSSGGWDRALADERRGDRFRDWQRDRDRTDGRDDRDRDGFFGDRDGGRDGDRDRFFGDRDRDGDGRQRFDADRRGPDRLDRDRVEGDRRPSPGADRSGIDRREEPGRERGPDGRDDGRGSSRGPMDRGPGRGDSGPGPDRLDRAPERGPDRADRGPDRGGRGPAGGDRGPDRPDRGPDRVQPDRGPSRAPADRGGRGPERAQPDRGPGREIDRPSPGRGGAPDRDRSRSEARPSPGSGRGDAGQGRRESMGRPDTGGRGERADRPSPGRGSGPSRSPGVSGRSSSDRERSQAVRPSKPPASRAPSVRSQGGDRSRGPQGGGRSVQRPSGGDRRGGAPSMQRGGRSDSGSRGRSSVQRGGRSDSGSRGGGSVQRGSRGDSGSRGGGSVQRGGRDGGGDRGSRGGGRDSRGSRDSRGGRDRGRGR